MKRSLAVAIALASAIPVTALAHKAWLQPSQTVIAGTNPWITVDAAVSNDLFYFNHVPLRTEGLAITAPDGSAVEAQNLATGKYRTVFDVELKQQGTYRIATVNSGLFASYKDAKGQPKRWRGTPEKFAAEVPADAQELKVTQAVGRIETFVTLGKPSAIAATGQGLELLPTPGHHPNDLVAGEAATLRLTADGQPAANITITLTPGGSRYRDSINEIKVTTDAQGEFTVTWPTAGAYWLEAELKDDKTTLPQAKERRLTYAGTLEVLP